MPPIKSPYPPEFRREAIQLARTSERSIAQVARDLGVSSQTLRNWIKQADVDAGKREGVTMRSELVVDALQMALARRQPEAGLSTTLTRGRKAVPRNRHLTRAAISTRTADSLAP
jgi:transposase-like protein